MRTARIKIKGRSAVYHIVTRVMGGQLLLGEVERDRMQLMIREHAGFSGVEILTYCVLGNRYHLLVRVPKKSKISNAELVRKVREFYGENNYYRTKVEDAFGNRGGKLPGKLRQGLLKRIGDVSFFMKELNQRYTKWFNRQHGRRGTLWAERFKSDVIKDEPGEVAKLAAYVDLNPVSAGLVEDPQDYRWCGYAEAVAGSREAREGIASFLPGKDWRTVGAAYRKHLFGQADISGH